MALGSPRHCPLLGFSEEDERQQLTLCAVKMLNCGPMNSRQVLCIPVLVLAVSGYTQKAYTIRLNPKVGKTYQYVTKMTGTMSMSMTMSMKPVKVDASNIVFETRIGMATGLPAQASDMLKKMVMTITEDRSGHTKKISVTGVDPQIAAAIEKQGGAGNSSQATYPDHPVKVGDKWSGVTSTAGQSFKATFKLVSVQTNGGRTIANLTSTISSSGAIQFKGPSKLSIDLADGMLIEDVTTIVNQGRTLTVDVRRS